MDALARDGDFFEREVRPLLVAKCLECHSGDKAGGGLLLDSRDGWQRGGDGGAVIVPGDPAGSRLVKAVGWEDEALRMPPADAGGRLDDAQIATLVAWVRDGAFDPRQAAARIGGMSPAEAADWWAFQPLPGATTALTSGEIDRRLDEALADAGLDPAPPADPRTLVRRLSYDLTGLPPTPEMIDAFAADPSDAAYEALVDQLLASPQYGVQMGRRWLDVVRYADTAGENTDRPLPHAWRYRNWVFDAFHTDLPFDRFVRLQIAGDLLAADAPAPERAAAIVATGYLAVARRFGHDIDKDVHLMHEDVIDNVGRAFLGLSLACARCHDHKYDPVTAADYYALSGILASTRFAFPGCEAKGQPRDTVPLLPPDEVETRLAPYRERVAARAAAVAARAAEADPARLAGLAAGHVEILVERPVGEGAAVILDADEDTPLEVVLYAGDVLQVVVLPGGSHGADTTLVDWWIEERAANGGANGSRRWSTADVVASGLEVSPVADADGPRWCFLERAPPGPIHLDEHKRDVAGAPELRAWTRGDTPSVLVNVGTAAAAVWTTLPARSLFVHPGPDRPVIVAWVCPRDGVYRTGGRVADAHPAAIDGVSVRLEHVAAASFGPALVAAGRFLGTPLPEPGPEPIIPVAYAVVEGTPHDVAIAERGDPAHPGAVVPRRWLGVFGGATLPSGAGSGRRELADWIVDQPLFARVAVNRIWQWHYGTGLVRTANDFGTRGARPSHPRLLDRLAAGFVAGGYDVRSLSRELVRTEAYRRSSTPTAAARLGDPDARLLSHMPRRRLTAEELRDSLLAVAGALDTTPAEAHPFPPEASWTFTQHAPFVAVYETPKRSAYLMVQRQRRHPFLALFDGADPNASSPRRETSTVPTQALWFLNDSFFHAQAAGLAHRTADHPDPAGRVERMFRLALGRSPDAAERDGLLALMADGDPQSEAAWEARARVILASNEFLHVD
ncbi:MAG: DUF1553 domain-containing protein [Planctomycetaceae bacterium]